MKTVDLIDRAVKQLPKIGLRIGGHDYPFEYARDSEDLYHTGDKGTCLMEAVAFIAQEQHSDHPKCASPTLTAFGIELNDFCPDDRFRNEILKPIIPVLLNTSDKGYRRGRPMNRRFENAVDKYLAELLIVRLKLDPEEVVGYSSLRILGTAVINADDSNRKLKKVLRIAASCLRDAACFAREQLGPDVDAPVAQTFLNPRLLEQTDANRN